MVLARRAPLRLRVSAALRECLRASLAQRRSDAARKPTGLGSWTRDKRRGACARNGWPKYRFKDWTVTETRKLPVTAAMREARALQIAQALMDHQRWHSHGRPISIEVLRRDLKLKIDDYGTESELSQQIHDYHVFLGDYMSKIGALGVVHTNRLCIKF
jgi:hypothetical protein